MNGTQNSDCDNRASSLVGLCRNVTPSVESGERKEREKITLFLSSSLRFRLSKIWLDDFIIHHCITTTLRALQLPSVH